MWIIRYKNSAANFDAYIHVSDWEKPQRGGHMTLMREEALTFFSREQAELYMTMNLSFEAFEAVEK